MAKISVRSFEEKVEAIEGIVIAVHAPSEALVEDYSYERKCPSGHTVSEWLEKRVNPLTGGLGVRVIDGEHGAPNKRQNMDTLRKTYK